MQKEGCIFTEVKYPPFGSFMYSLASHRHFTPNNFILQDIFPPSKAFFAALFPGRKKVRCPAAAHP